MLLMAEDLQSITNKETQLLTRKISNSGIREAARREIQQATEKKGAEMITEICLVVLALLRPILACFAYRQNVKDMHTNTMPPTKKASRTSQMQGTERTEYCYRLYKRNQ